MQYWEPDTCECKVAEEMGTNNDLVTVTVQRACPAHVGLTPAEWDTAVRHGENRPKNRVQGAMMERLTQAVDTDARGYKTWKSGISCTWRFTGTGKDRILYLRLTGYTLTAAQKTVLDTWLASSPDAGRVVIEV